MAYDLSVWLTGVILLLPMVVFGLAWAAIKRFYERGETRREQRRFYIAALFGGSLSTITYIGYWSWRVCQLYHATIPLPVLLALDRSIYAARAASIAAVLLLLIGRGPYRIPVFLATLWVTFQLWAHGGIIHRA
jgi:hypothetical protein